jgi:hypothetical protein
VSVFVLLTQSNDFTDDESRKLKQGRRREREREGEREILQN